MVNKAIIKSFLVICLGYCVSVWGETEVLAKRLFDAHEKGLAIPTLSQEVTLDMAAAYAVQTAYIRTCLTKDKIAGFKAGLTSQDAQAHVGINRAMVGVLLKSGDLSNQSSIPLKKFKQLIVETELGFITNRSIKRPITTIAELQSYIEKIVPVIELADVGFDKSPVLATDLVAANAAAAAYIYRKDLNWYGQDVNSITVSLSRNGKILNQGHGDDAFGDQWEALRWLVNQVIANGWSIEKGSLLITGALGGMVPGVPGHYRAQFNDEAILAFDLVH